MTLTADQKKALIVAGGVAVLIVLYMMTRSSSGTVLPSQSVPLPAAGTFDNSVPGYTTYNVQPLDIPAPGVSNPIAHMVGTGCCAKTDGCFTYDPLSNGQGPLSLEQLLAGYSAAGQNFDNLVAQSQSNYNFPAPTIQEMTQQSCGNNPLNNLAISAVARQSQFYAGGGFGNNCWSDSYYPL
jgi:hypothetical protein